MKRRAAARNTGAKRFDPVEREIFRNLFNSVAEEMGVVLQRTAFSPNIKERRDYSCAVFDEKGALVAQGDHMPVHLGSMPASVDAVLGEIWLGLGDVAILNDPFAGGTHLPDVTLVSGVFLGRRAARADFYVASRAHHADVGGMAPGSMPLSTEIYQEGLRIPPLLLTRAGERDRAAWDLILANVRTPEEREGDLAAQLAAHHRGTERLTELARRHGASRLRSAAADLQDYAERAVRQTLSKIPDGVYRFADELDDDGVGPERIPIAVTIEIRGGSMKVDFEGTGLQVAGSMNAVAAITVSAVSYVVRCLLPTGTPANAGSARPIDLRMPAGSVVRALPPAAVAGGNVETSQRITDVLLGALAQAVPDLVPAASGGTMNNVTFGGVAEPGGKPFAYYETLACGAGGGPLGPGEHGVHTHMTNSRNTPVEALENELPVRIRAYALRRGTGGAGKHRGGDGLVREYEFLTSVQVGMLSERRECRPYGLSGGFPGEAGRNSLIREGRKRNLPSKFSLRLGAGDRLRIETPGGGGFGKPDPGRATRERIAPSRSRRRRS